MDDFVPAPLRGAPVFIFGVRCPVAGVRWPVSGGRCPVAGVRWRFAPPAIIPRPSGTHRQAPDTGGKTHAPEGRRTIAGGERAARATGNMRP